MTLPIYDPEVSYNPIYCPRNGKKPYLRYNHDVDIVRFQGKFLASWNANETGAEGVSGQFNFLSVSEDFIHWSTPVKLFTAAAGCPTLDGLGTTGGHVHQLGEYINLSHLPFRPPFTAEPALRVRERGTD